jgi:large conductance mechanosensitive channel
MAQNETLFARILNSGVGKRHKAAMHEYEIRPERFGVFWNNVARETSVSNYNFHNEMGVVMGMLQEFRAFAIKGNVIDLAVGVIIGAAFSKIVDSLVQDVIMPVAGRIFGGLDFSNYYLPLNGQGTAMTLVEAKKAGAVLAYGSFITILLNFIILAFIIFQMVRLVNKAKRRETEETAPTPAATPEDIVLLREIRDSLKR